MANDPVEHMAHTEAPASESEYVPGGHSVQPLGDVAPAHQEVCVKDFWHYHVIRLSYVITFSQKHLILFTQYETNARPSQPPIARNSSLLPARPAAVAARRRSFVYIGGEGKGLGDASRNNKPTTGPCYFTTH